MGFKIELGVTAKDKITGFSGIVMARIEYLTGCMQYSIQPPKLGKDGKVQDQRWFDEDRLVVTGIPKKNKVETKGGPESDAPTK